MAGAAPIPRALTIAGSDSGGGAGIQADLKTFAALGVYGMSAITAVTAQNTHGVRGIHELPPIEVALQIEAVLEDIGVDAMKTGMLASAAIVEAVAAVLRSAGAAPLVIDPVMVAKSGDVLLQDSACTALVRELLPLAAVVTPNLPEAEILAGMPVRDEESVAAAAARIHALGPAHVLIKGGHLAGAESVDYLYDGQGLRAFAAPRMATPNTHGTGCTYSAAIAAELARGAALPEAISAAKAYVNGALRHALALGKPGGHGPLHHGWRG